LFYAFQKKGQGTNRKKHYPMKTFTSFLTGKYNHISGLLLIVVLFFSTATVNAQGSCLSGNCTNGNGTYKFPSGALFEGSFKDGKMVKGTYKFTNGDFYSGYFSNNKFHGQGRYQYKQSGNIYSGTYANGQKTNGTFTYNDRSTYTGSFKNHKKDGRGKLVTSTGKVLDGYWDADMYSGTKPNNKVQTWALIVGVADYKNSGPRDGDLTFTTNDARAFSQFLQSDDGGNVPAGNIKMLLDNQAGLSEIVSYGKQLFSNADENDRIIFFFSGHGSPSGLIPYDYDSFFSNILTYDKIKELFAVSKASTKLVFADACHSGAIKKEASSKSAAEVLQDLEPKSTLPQSNRRNIAIMLSSDGDQVSYETPSLNQGVFAFYLMKGLGGAADKNNDNLITMAEAYYYVRDNTYNYVRDNMRSTQTPILFGNFDKEMIIGTY